MLTLFYGSLFVLSLILSAGYIYIWHKHFDVNFTMIFTLVPISCLGYILYSLSKTLEGVLICQKIIYIGGLFLQYFILLGILNLSRINIPKWIRTAAFVISVLTYGSVLSIGYSGIFYKEATLDLSSGIPVLIKKYGPFHDIYYVVLSLFFVAGIVSIIYAWLNKKEASRRILMMLFIPDVICILSYFVGRMIIDHYDLMPLGYVIAQIIYILIAFRVNLYDIGDTVIDSMVHESQIGYITFDFRYRYLGSNELARSLVPELNNVSVDEIFGYKKSERRVRHYLESFRLNQNDDTFSLTFKEENDVKYYTVNVSYLYDGGVKRGYIVTFRDDTENKKYIKLLDGYNEDLQREVNEKTLHIVKMHDNLIMSLAMMVESRDNSTGGHIKRTSEGVRILIEQIKKEGKLNLSDEFCKAVIKAAPMHDLGKIAVDDAVLRKPGRFTDEEYAKMKLHAQEGARVIHEILKDTDDEYFKVIAENVAHYHHERVDGSGYPKGLKGNEIPLEARIMAIADVYDALVSKRVYKEAFDFEKANSIIMEGMGTQFDPDLKSAYENARPALEAYYRGE